MNKKHVKGWLKHRDFIFLDLLCLQLSFVFAYWITRGYGNPYQNDTYLFQAAIFLLSQLFVILFSNNYQGILRRKRFDEVLAICKYIVEILLLALAYLFVVQRSALVSRLQFGVTAVFFVVLDYLARFLNKRRIRGVLEAKGGKKSVVLVTSQRLVPEAMEKLNAPDTYQDYFISGIVLLDGDDTEYQGEYGVWTMAAGKCAMEKISHNWVDEVFILQPDNMLFPTELMDDLMMMGITANYSISALNDNRWPITDMRKLGKYKVLTSSLHFATAGELALKRALDILGGIVGCLVTGILFLFIAPTIYAKSPGPIFFAQKRIGQNGKVFKMYKFRSMYMDAEERKAALMAQNKIADGMMFKLDDDPRIIGSERKDRNGKPRGIGNFIRNTSIDEFPQFFNVLRGEMSLVGTRPPTLDEWEKYDLEHRVRMSIKPGVTGLWQVSGRSEITDFDEVVRLDREYIETWTPALDIKLLLKTVVVVLKRKGAE